MLNKRNPSCSLIPSDQQSQCKESGITIASDTISSSSTTTTTTTIPSTYLLPPLLTSPSSLEPSTTSSTTTITTSRPNGSQLTEIGRNFPEKVSMVTQVSTSILSPSSTTDDDKIQHETTTCFNNSNNDNMTGNIEKIINCKSEQISVNLLSSKTFNKFTPNVFNLRPTISTHPTRKHHHHSHLSPSLSQHRRSELRRFNQNKGNDDSEGEGTTNCYTSSSEHSMETVIFCGKSMRSSCNANNQHHHQVHHSIPSSPKSSPSPGKPKVPTTTNGLSRTPMCQPMMMVIAKSSNCSNLNMTQQQSPKRYSSSSSNTTSSSPLINQLSIDPTINHSSDKKMNVKKLVCDIGTSPLHKNSLNCKTKCNRNDELWVDKPKKSKRKKPPHRISGVELWVDGPNAIPINSSTTSESTNCEFTEKHQRTTEWINQHAKTILIANNKGNSCCGQHWTSLNNCGKSINDTNITNPVTTSKSSKSNSSNGANGTIIDLNNPASPYHVGVSDLTIKEKHLIDKLIETKEMACQTESNEKLIVSESLNCTNNNNTNEKLNTEETLILLSNLHDNHEGDYEDDTVNDNDWTDERRLMLLERGALSDCCDNRVCCCCSSSFTSEEDDENVAVDDDKMIDKDKQTIELKSIKDDIGSTKENNLDSNTELIPNKLITCNELTEPPGQLKLEQFLKQLITVTNPSLNDNENMEKIKKDKDTNHHHHHHHQSHRSHHGHHGYHHHHHHHHHHAGERKLSQPINQYNDYPQYDSLPPRRLTRSKFNGTKYYDSFGSHQDLTNCSVDDNQINRLKSTLEDANCKSAGYIIAKDLPINDDCSANHVTLLPTSPRINRILGGVETKVDCINLTNSPSKSSRKQSCNKRDKTSTTTSGHGTTSEGDDRSVVTKKSSDSSSSPSQSNDQTFNSSSSSASQYHHHHHYHRSGKNSSGGPSSSGYDSTIKDEESDRELVIIDNDDQSNEINCKKLMITDEDNEITCNVVTLTANNNESANNSNDISNNGNNNNSNHTNLQGSCNIVKSSVKMRDKSEKQNRKNNKKDKEKDKRESLTSEKCSFLCCKLTSFY